LTTAQYSTLIYEFIDNHFDAFLSEDGEDLSYNDDVPSGLKGLLQNLRTNVLKKLTKSKQYGVIALFIPRLLLAAQLGRFQFL
jgi:hypothetical protein